MRLPQGSESKTKALSCSFVRNMINADSSREPQIDILSGLAFMWLEETKITVTYGFGDQGKNDSTMLLYRVRA